MCNTNLGWMRWFKWVDDESAFLRFCVLAVLVERKATPFPASLRSVISERWLSWRERLFGLSPPLLARGHTVMVRVHRIRHFCDSHSLSMTAAVHPGSSASCKGTLPHAWHQQWQTHSPQKAKGKKSNHLVVWQIRILASPGDCHSLACTYQRTTRLWLWCVNCLWLGTSLVKVHQDVDLLRHWMPMFAPSDT